MNDEDDPLDGADIGETREVRDEQTLRGINYAPMWPYGRDREGRAEIVDVELIETGEGDFNDIRVVWEGEVTKQLPRNWDQSNEPRTSGEEQQARRRTWAKKALGAVGFLLPVAIATLGAYFVSVQLVGEMTINGEPVPAPSPLMFIAIMGFASFLGLAIRHLPKTEGRRGWAL